MEHVHAIRCDCRAHIATWNFLEPADPLVCARRLKNALVIFVGLPESERVSFVLLLLLLAPLQLELVSYDCAQSADR